MALHPPQCSNILPGIHGNEKLVYNYMNLESNSILHQNAEWFPPTFKKPQEFQKFNYHYIGEKIWITENLTKRRLAFQKITPVMTIPPECLHCQFIKHVGRQDLSMSQCNTCGRQNVLSCLLVTFSILKYIYKLLSPLVSSLIGLWNYIDFSISYPLKKVH